MAEKQERQYAPDEVNKHGEYIKIGGSPVPGITLRKVLRGHAVTINEIAWSSITKSLVSTSGQSILFWDGDTGNILENFPSNIIAWSVAWSPLGKFIASRTVTHIQIWEYSKKISFYGIINNNSSSTTLSWSPDERILAYVSNDRDIHLWDSKTSEIVRELKKHTSSVHTLAWSIDGKFLASGSQDRESLIYVWDMESYQVVQEFKLNNGAIHDLLWKSDGDLLICSTSEGKIHVLDIKHHRVLLSIEGHTNGIGSITLSADGSCLASKSSDNTVRLWNCSSWETAAILSEQYASYRPKIAFHPRLPLLATLGGDDTLIRIWELDEDTLLGQAQKNINYTTAKLVLVGDSGVGKTGLGWRLAHNEFKEHASTHGQQFWVIPELGLKRKDGTECEAVLWDLAGQHIYRSIHSIFLDDVDASLVLFDPTNRQEPLKGTQFWLEQLKGKKNLPPSVLVGARLDRGSPVLSQQELDQFCQKYGISGGYIGTSAKSGEGLDKLLESLKSQIPWDQMTTTVTTVTFKRIKEFVLSLKEKPDRQGVLLRPDELRKQLQVTDKDWQFTDAEMMTAVGHLANHGYVTILKNSSGEEFILLVPESLASVASSIFLHADKHPRELGAINETDLLQGKYFIEEFKGLEKEEQQVLLDATVVRFLEHSICFRETLGSDNLLIFPSLIKQKRPLQDEFESTDDISYIVRGRIENIYASLVVLLGYTSAFTRINQWQNQAQYVLGEEEICGFRLFEERESELELVFYYSIRMPAYGRIMFQGLFESFLYKRDVEVTRFPPVFCRNKHRIERATVIKRVRDGKDFAFCDECGEKTTLPEIEKPEMLGAKETRQVEREEALAKLRSVYETNLVRVKGFRRDRVAPRCYISHADDNAEWVLLLTRDLRDAGVFVLENNAQLKDSDFILQVCTPAYKESWDKSAGRPGEDAVLIRARLAKNITSYPTVIPLRSEGKAGVSIPSELSGFNMADFRTDTIYSVSLFDLVMSLYAIPLNHEGFKPLRELLRNQWEQTLARSLEAREELYISYAWGKEDEEREAIVNELDTVFQERGVTIIRDKRELGFKGRIKEFMETIGQGKAIILVISEKYLRSPNCCFELVQIAKHGNFADRIFPVVLADANIYDPVSRIRYVEYWEKKKDELDDVMKSVSAANLVGFREDIDLYTEIRALLPRLMDVLKDMNTFTPDLHRQSDFSEIFEAVMAKLEE